MKKIVGFLLAALMLLAGRLEAAPALIVYGDASVAASERRFVASLAHHAERWYASAGVPCALASDRALAASLEGKRVAVLISVMNPSPEMMRALTAFVRRGGKLIVFYSSSEALAGLFGVKCVGYRNATTAGQWSSMAFNDSRPRGAPPVILQTSTSLFLVAPVEGRTRVLAWWCDRSGRPTSEAAWLTGPAGYWMTHVFSGDGDTAAKAQLLLALTAAHDPSIWTEAAKQKLAAARKVCGAEGPEAIQARARKLADPARRARALAGASGAATAALSASRLVAAGKGFEACRAADDCRDRMLEAYGLLQSPRHGEIRAIWDHTGQGLYPGDWVRTCKLLKNAGFSDLYVNVAGAGFAHYASDVLPRSHVMAVSGDQLAACLAAARPFGLRVHAWILCFSTEGATPERVETFRRRGWLLPSTLGAAHPWLNPAMPAVQAYLLQAIEEIATRYAVSGIHLDFVRYPDFNSGLTTSGRAAFERALGRSVRSWPDDVKAGGPLFPLFVRWRARPITAFVSGAHRILRRRTSGKILTAAVYGKYPSCFDSVGQDWEAWLTMGLLDYAVPMNYTESRAKFAEWIAGQTRSRAIAQRVIPGIGVSAAESRLSAAQTIDQINLVRASGAPGFALFKLDTTVRQEVLPILRLGVTAGK